MQSLAGCIHPDLEVFRGDDHVGLIHTFVRTQIYERRRGGAGGELFRPLEFTDNRPVRGKVREGGGHL